jgi:hypothetical protein
LHKGFRDGDGASWPKLSYNLLSENKRSFLRNKITSLERKIIDILRLPQGAIVFEG